jgi:hypothetical protein
MPATYTTLTLTQDATTIYLDGTDGKYILQENGWDPAVSRWVANDVGGRLPYEDVEEEITINIVGTSPSDTIANAEALAGLLESANRFWRTGQNSPVLVNCQPNGSVLASPVNAMLVGGDCRLELPLNWSEFLMVNEIRNARVVFMRRGLWAGAETTTNGSASVGHKNNDSLTVLSLPNSKVPALCRFSWKGAGFSANSLISGIVAMVGYTANSNLGQDLRYVTLLVAGSAGADVVEAGSSRGSIRRLTPSATTMQTVTFDTVNSSVSNSRQWDIYIKLRNRSTNSVNWSVYASASLPWSSVSTTFTPTTVIPYGSTGPQVVSLGRFSIPTLDDSGSLRILNLAINCTPSAASGAGHELDIDSILLVAVSDASNIIQINSVKTGSSYDSITMEHGYLTALEPVMLVGTATTGLKSFSRRGDVFCLIQSEPSLTTPVYAALYVVDTAVPAFTPSTYGSVQPIYTFRPLYLTPQ